MIEYDYDKYEEAYTKGSPNLILGYEKLRSYAWDAFTQGDTSQARLLYLLARIELIAGYKEEKDGACFRNADSTASFIYARIIQ